MRILSEIAAKLWADQSSTSSFRRNGASFYSGFQIIHLFPGLFYQLVTEMTVSQYFFLPGRSLSLSLLPQGQISKNTCFFPSSSVFVLNCRPSVIHPSSLPILHLCVFFNSPPTFLFRWRTGRSTGISRKQRQGSKSLPPSRTLSKETRTYW